MSLGRMFTAWFIPCCIFLFGTFMLSCQGNVDQQFDIFVVKIHTTKLSNGNRKKGQASECDFSGVFEDLKKYKSFKDTIFVVYGNNAPVGNGRPAGEVDFLQYRDTEDDSTTPIYPILVEIITMVDKSELPLDREEINTIKSCVKKHVHVQTSRINTRYMFVIQTNNGSIIEKDPYIDPNLCNFEQRLTERLDKSLV